jgi:hypothetical protein
LTINRSISLDHCSAVRVAPANSERKGPFKCAAARDINAATGRDFAAQDAGIGCLYRQDGKASGGQVVHIVVMHPPYSAGTEQETLPGYRRDLQEITTVRDADGLGPEAFIAGDDIMCAAWAMAPDGLPMMIQVQHMAGSSATVCAIAEKTAALLRH